MFVELKQNDACRYLPRWAAALQHRARPLHLAVVVAALGVVVTNCDFGRPITLVVSRQTVVPLGERLEP